MVHLIQKIDAMIEERTLLKHPFYQMWSDGKLTKESLAGYSKEYFQLVKAVPVFMSPIIQQSPPEMIKELVANQQEEAEHILSWKKFASSLGVSESELDNYDGLRKTRLAVENLSNLMGDYYGGACAMYAFEKEIPKISQTKLDGLKDFYGITSPDATEYFRLHTEADIRHAAAWRTILETSQSEEDLLKIADRSISAQHLLLDSCYEEYC